MTTSLLANRYQVLELLGEGTMGRVSLVEDTTNGRHVALKVIANRAGTHDNHVLQFKQEFRLMAQLRHPNCCQVHDFGVLATGEPYFTMEAVPGQGLDEVNLPLPESEFRRILVSLLQALAHVHQLGYVHRDVKAANVRLMQDGTVKLMDFGLMDYAGRAGAPISGTPATMAPEVIKRAPIDQRSDLYSLGCLAYQLLSGRLPFGGGDTRAEALLALRAHIHDRPESIERLVPHIAPDLAKIIMRLLAKDPLERYRSADEVLTALGEQPSPGANGNLLSSPLMGRELELGVLRERLGELMAFEPGGAILLYGTSGMGKTRLVDELRLHAQLEGACFASGLAHEQGSAPYAAVIEIVTALLPALRACVPALLEQHAPVLVKLLPGLAVAPAPDIDPPSKEKLRLQSTLLDLITRLARVQPTVLALEDWQWADPLSREFLDFLARNTREEPLLLLLTARPTLHEELRVPDGFRKLTVGPLDVQGIRRMVTSMLGTADVEAGFIEKVTTFSEGNPYYVKELLEHLVQDATLVLTDGGWDTHIELTPDRLPVNLKGLLIRKVTYLPPRAQELARLAAAIGHPFEVSVLQDASGLSDDELFAAIEMLRHNLVFESREGGRYAFAQDQLQAMLYDYIPAIERKRLHLAIGHALERAHVAHQAEPAELESVSAIAHHYIRAGQPEKIITYALAAGRMAAGLFANADARRYLSAGLDAVRDADTQSYPRERFDYMRTLGDVLRMLGETQEAIQVYTEAIVLLEAAVQAAEPWGEPGLVAHLMVSLAKCWQMQGDLPEALVWCERALDASIALDDRVAASRCLLTRCRIYYFMGQAAEAIADTERGLAFARAAGDTFRIGEALAFLGYIYLTFTSDKIELGIGLLHESVEILSSLGDKIGLQNCYNLLGNAQNMLGDFAAAKETFSLDQKLCYEVGMRDDEINCYLNLAVCGLELGEFEEAVGAAQSAYAYAVMNQNKFNIGLALIMEATAKVYLGQFQGATALFDRALALALETGHKYIEMMVSQYKVETFLVLGHLGEAKTAAKKLIGLIQETGDTSPDCRMKAFLGEIVARQGDMMGGREYTQLAITQAMMSRAKGIQARAMRVDAWISLQAGEWAEAKELALGGLVTAQAIGARYQVAELYGILGEIALATHAEDPMPHFEAMETLARQMKTNLLLAQALFGQAATIGHPMKAVPLVQQAKALLEGLLLHLDEESKMCFANLRERDRILQGDFINGFKPRARQLDVKVSLPGIKLGQNVWGLT